MASVGTYILGGVLSSVGKQALIESENAREEAMEREREARADARQEREFKHREKLEGERQFSDLANTTMRIKSEEGQQAKLINARMSETEAEIASREREGAADRAAVAGTFSNRKLQPDADGNSIIVLPDGSTKKVMDEQGRPVPFRDSSSSLEENRAIKNAIDIYTTTDPETGLEELDTEGAAQYLEDKGFTASANAIRSRANANMNYSSPADVRTAFEDGRLTEAEARRILVEQFGFDDE